MKNQPNNGTTNSAAAEKQRRWVRNTHVLKRNVLHSEIGMLRMRETSPANRAAYVTSAFLPLAQ
jgi:hypothetical protein